VLYSFAGDRWRVHIGSIFHGAFLQIYLLYGAVSLAYILSYPAAQAGSPSFIILAIIKSSMPRGITKDEIRSRCRDNKLFGSGIHDLVDENLVADKNGYLEVTKKGRMVLKFFAMLRKIFGLPAGKG
jgi:predicted transcriptional regulator